MGTTLSDVTRTQTSHKPADSDRYMWTPGQKHRLLVNRNVSFREVEQGIALNAGVWDEQFVS